MKKFVSQKNVRIFATFNIYKTIGAGEACITMQAFFMLVLKY